MERTIRRRAASVANDERILDAAIALIDERGVDRVTVVDLASAAGFTTGAVYARYQDLPELLADVWARRGAAVSEGLVAEAAGLAAGRPGVPVERLADLLASTPVRRVAVELLAVTPRVDELGDLVQSTLERSLRAEGLVDASGAVDDAVGVGLLGLALGSIAYGTADGSLEADAAAIAGWLRVGGAHRWSTPPPAPIPRREIRFVPASPGHGMAEVELRRLRLLDAAVTVVARSGIARATFRRIGRASGYTSTAVYADYAGVHDLLVDLVRTFAAASLRVAPDATRFTDPDLEGALLTGGMAPSGRTIRRLAVEFQLAHRDPDLGPLTAAVDRDQYHAIATLLAGPAGPAHDTIVRYRYAHRALGLGLALLEDAVGGLPDTDWRPILGAIQLGALAAAGVRHT